MHEVGFYLTAGGQDSAKRPETLPESKYARGVNVAVENGFPGTRIAVRVVPMEGGAADFFAAENFQGGMRYNPAEGQGAVLIGKDESSMLFAVGGRRLQIKLSGRGTATAAVAEDVSAGVVGNGDLHLAYWSQWENYALSGDGNGNTWIWDGSTAAFPSPGYSLTDRPNSHVPNGGTAMGFVHGRGCMVVNSRALLVGDMLNSADQTSAKDVIKFTEQTYFATGQYFSPPTRMGAITAFAVLPLKDTAHGHGEAMLHCWDGIFSVDLNVFPRTKWSETPMVKTAHLGSGACGPYAVDIFDGDQLFRSRVGMQTLRSARAESARAGSPHRSIAVTVKPFLAADFAPFLRFASVKTWEREARAVATCAPIVQGRFRWHRGFISCNFDPLANEDAPAMWEGMWTLPPEIGGVVQFIGGDFDGEERLFAVCHSPADGRNRLVEFRRDLSDDVLPDGSRRRIRSQLVSRRVVTLSRPLAKKNWESGTLYLCDLRGRVDWGVWVRTTGSRKWQFWRGGYVENCGECQADGCNLAEPDPWEGEISLGSLDKLPCFKKSARGIQFLVRWAGRCQVEAIRIGEGGKDPDEDSFKPGALAVKVGECNRSCPEYDDFEYLETPEAESWLSEIKPCP